MHSKNFSTFIKELKEALAAAYGTLENCDGDIDGLPLFYSAIEYKSFGHPLTQDSYSLFRSESSKMRLTVVVRKEQARLSDKALQQKTKKDIKELNSASIQAENEKIKQLVEDLKEKYACPGDHKGEHSWCIANAAGRLV